MWKKLYSTLQPDQGCALRFLCYNVPAENIFKLQGRKPEGLENPLELIVGRKFQQVFFYNKNTREILKNAEIKGITGRLKYEAEKLLESKKEFSYKMVNDVQTASQEVVEELDIKGLVKWLLNRYLSAFGFFPIKRVLGEVTEHIQKIIQRKKRRMLKIFTLL